MEEILTDAGNEIVAKIEKFWSLTADWHKKIGCVKGCTLQASVDRRVRDIMSYYHALDEEAQADFGLAMMKALVGILQEPLLETRGLVN